MRSILGVVMLLASIAPLPLVAQPIEFVPKAMLEDSIAATDNQYRRFFSGITMSAEAEGKARELLRRAYVQGLSLEPIETRETWNRLVRMRERRDSLLMALVKDRTQRATLNARLESVRPKRSFWDEHELARPARPRRSGA